MLNYLFRQVMIPLRRCCLRFAVLQLQMKTREKDAILYKDNLLCSRAAATACLIYTSAYEAPSLSIIYFLPLAGALALPLGLTGLINLSLLKSLT